MQIDPNSRVSHSASIEIDASAQKVWDVMSDIENWPKWNSDIKSAKLNGRLYKGTTFTWKAGPGTITSTLEVVNKPSLLGWSGKLFGIKAVHIWRIASKDMKTVVTTEESWDGFLPKIFRNSSKKTLKKAIDNGLVQLKKAVESQLK
jgi:hypothetical protein